MEHYRGITRNTDLSCRRFSAVLCIIGIFSITIATGTFAPPLTVVENTLRDANNNVVRLEGFAVFDANKWNDKSIVSNWKDNWKVNAVRLVLRPDQWFINHDATAREAYLKRVDTFLEWCKEYRIYVIFDGYHESGSTGNVDHHWGYCKKVWPILAKRYKDIDFLLWEIYNEPYQISWVDWVPKARELIDTIRSYDPVVKVCVVPGIDWATEVAFDKAAIDREQIVYSFHIYPHVYWHSWTKETWSRHYGFISEKKMAPVYIGEWHARTSEEINVYGKLLLSYMKEIGASQTLWGYFPGWGGNLVDNGLGQSEKKSMQGEWFYKYLNGASPTQPAAPPPAVRDQPPRFTVNSGALTCRGIARDIGITVFDMQGRLIFSRTDNPGNAGCYRLPLPLERFSNGKYLLELKMGTTAKTFVLPVAR